MDATTNISVVQRVCAHGHGLPCIQADRWPQSYSSISMTVVCQRTTTSMCESKIKPTIYTPILVNWLRNPPHAMREDELMATITSSYGQVMGYVWALLRYVCKLWPRIEACTIIIILHHKHLLIQQVLFANHFGYRVRARVWVEDRANSLLSSRYIATEVPI